MSGLGIVLESLGVLDASDSRLEPVQMELKFDRFSLLRLPLTASRADGTYYVYGCRGFVKAGGGYIILQGPPSLQDGYGGSRFPAAQIRADAALESSLGLSPTDGGVHRCWYLCVQHSVLPSRYSKVLTSKW